MNAFLCFNFLNKVSGEFILRFLQGLIAESGGIEDALVSKGGLQLGLKVRDLTLELRDDLGVLRNMILHIVHVTLHVSLYVFGSICIFQSVVCVFITLTRGRNVGNHNGTAVSTK
jgi:hypothetical protein